MENCKSQDESAAGQSPMHNGARGEKEPQDQPSCGHPQSLVDRSKRSLLAKGPEANGDGDWTEVTWVQPQVMRPDNFSPSSIEDSHDGTSQANRI